MSSSFYSAFEDRFRGSRDLIRERLSVYASFVRPLAQHFAGSEVLDLGCGRGECLEEMRAHGFRPFGVDLDDRMLADCRSRDLPAMQGDAIAYLRSLPDNSQAVVSALHLIEHISFDELKTLVSEAHRALRPGGLMILETPNAENLIVGSSSFYLDPTHIRPVHPHMLAFLAEYSGFARSKLIRLNERLELRDWEEVKLLDVLEGVSPDVTVIAQKGGDDAIVERLNGAFAREYGLSLADLAIRHQRSHDRRIAALQAELRDVRIEFRNELELLTPEWQKRAKTLAASALRAVTTRPRALVGRSLRRGVSMVRRVVLASPRLHQFARATLASIPHLKGFVARFSPVSATGAVRVYRFEDLRSVRVMKEVELVANANMDGSVTFLKMDANAR